MAKQKIIVTAIVEVLGSPQSHVEDTLKLLLKKIGEGQTWKMLKGQAFEAKEVKNEKDKTSLWTGFIDIELEFKRFEDLTGFCFDHYPSSIEIIEPEYLNIRNNDFSALFNDLSARLHKTHEIVKDVHASNKLLVKQLDEITSAIKAGKK